MIDRGRKIGFRTRVVALVGLAVLPPWLACILLAGGASIAGPATALACALAAAGALFGLARALRPFGRLARALDEDGDPCDPDPETMLARVEALKRKVIAFHHRWSERHPLTLLPTREYLLREMKEDVDAGAGEVMLGIVRLRDYDRLSAFDSERADRALEAFAALLAGAVGSKHPLAHVDRDSFAIWFRGCAPDDAKIQLRALCYALGGELMVAGEPLMPEIDAGAGIYPIDGADPAAIVTRTLLSLGGAGRPDGGALRLLAPKPVNVARERFSLEQDLRHAIARDQLELHFQPIVDLAQAKLVGAEALIRWHHPEAGLISPSRFIPILEDANLTDEIGMWTLNAACRAARNWRTRGIEGVTVAVNLSATQLRNEELARIVGRTLERHQLAPKALELELTETAATEDADRTFRLFSALRAMGVSLAIDDFGSGYSSLSYVKNLPFDKLKIDREFVIDVHERRDSQAICRTLIELARGLGIRILAEGVEKEEEAEFLQRLGCNLFQGFYFSKPLPEAEFIAKARGPALRDLLAHPFPGLDPAPIDRMTA
jgi:EAL domain-containing protein (putative c-di-GMP-specific phosphodiesterase class I)/GGDEF domain-containing protein